MSERKLSSSFAKYAVVSGLSFIVNFAITIFLHEAVGLSEELSYAIALVVVFAMNFALMRYWVYAHTLGESGARRQLILTAVSSVTFRALEYGAFLVLSTWLGMYYLLAMLLIMVVSNLSKFFFYHSVVFARRSNK